MAALIKDNNEWELYNEPDLDIVGYFKSPSLKKLSELNRRNKAIFNAGMNNTENGFHLSLFKVSAEVFNRTFPHYNADAPNAVILRSVMMKDEHTHFTDELARRLFAVKIPSGKHP